MKEIFIEISMAFIKVHMIKFALFIPPPLPGINCLAERLILSCFIHIENANTCMRDNLKKSVEFICSGIYCSTSSARNSVVHYILHSLL